MTDIFGPVIHSYSRAQAIEDGALVAVSPEVAAEAGFRYPVALTAAAHADAVAWDHGGFQDEAGRLWDVLWMARLAAGCASGGSRLVYTLLRVPNEAGKDEPEMTTLVLHIGPGDELEPVMTIMTPGED